MVFILQPLPCRQIIAFLREGQPEGTNTDCKTFSDVSIDDWDFIMEAITEDDNHQFNQYKLSYSPLSNQLVATLPTPIHENILKPFFIVQMNSTLRGEGEVGSTEKALGIPDALVEFHNGDRGHLQLWGTEVVRLQTWDATIAKLQCSVTCNRHMQAVTLFDILENHRYSPPAESSRAFQKLSKKDKVTLYHKWLQKDDSPVFSLVTGFTHTWVSPLTIVVTTWLHPDDGPFDLYDHDSRYFTTGMSFLPSLGVAVSDHDDMQLCPNMDVTSLDNLQQLFHCTFESVRDTTITYIEELMVEEEEESSALSDNSDIIDESNIDNESNIAEASTILEEINDSPDPLQLIRTWVPLVSPIDWKKFMPTCGMLHSRWAIHITPPGTRI
ncbi:uncharacterized protein EDB91DRAFT_1082117 [Suillus paluster]|uniref:uncharacterized protein n=1 Tax=Suillus paluster TaxID=48578 RepID=UPI001B880737|nr:uncharacterized protein EDB91DRAFT_1082117 [Suillus paluster]KAG1740140.1 hypothetical protein EDB91DRAFT_1082117 [Suillus paluster]